MNKEKELDNDYTDVLIKREEARQVIRDYKKIKLQFCSFFLLWYNRK